MAVVITAVLTTVEQSWSRTAWPGAEHRCQEKRRAALAVIRALALVAGAAGLMGTPALCSPRPRPTGQKTSTPLARQVPLLIQAPPAPPALRWEKRSDWIDVRKDVTPPAAGDGKADDTDALQQGLDRVAAAAHEGGTATGDGATLYLPPGVYRITRTLSLTGPIVGATIVGSGSSTRLVWDGAAAGRMLHLNGVSYSSFVGMELDGRGKATVGFYYNSDKRFQTEVTHRHLAFRGFTSAGVLNDPARVFALAETTFENCLFEDCERGVAFPQFNDYDYTFDGCEFWRCGTGIECVHGNFYVRNCRFVGSRSVDISDASEHGSSVRRCSST
ncbi:MAG: glycoside hydrolase family 55 protein, partial [Chloroflexi bacterium]|nr:glycoside hydrolase family 55 protein [Chloroflexota bacterium]